MRPEITFDDFSKVDIRIGTIIEVTDFPKAHNPAYQLTIDFGVLGIKKSSAQITDLYTKKDLLHKQIIAIVNFKKKVAFDYVKKRWTYALGGASASITSYSIALWAMTVAPVAAIAALRETSVLFAILFGAWFLNEKINSQRLLSIFMIVLGAMAIKFST